MSQQQISTVTNRGRHLPLMRDAVVILRDRNSRNGKLRVLSFGCSTGGECLDLADLIPEADIFGCDINPAALSEARRNCGGRAVIRESDIDALEAAGPFDAVFVLSVLCRYPKSAGLDDVSSVYPFPLFEDAVGGVDRLVGPGGVLGLYNAQYCFEDSAISRHYDRGEGGACTRNGWIEKCLPDGRRATDVVWTFDGNAFDRAAFAQWMREPANKERARIHMDRLHYAHSWIDPAFAEGRSTRHALWIKRAGASGTHCARQNASAGSRWLDGETRR